MRIGIPLEVHPGEKRVATTPDVVAQLIELGFTVGIETGAGANHRVVGDTIGKPEAGSPVVLVEYAAAVATALRVYPSLKYHIDGR